MLVFLIIIVLHAEQAFNTPMLLTNLMPFATRPRGLLILVGATGFSIMLRYLAPEAMRDWRLVYNILLPVAYPATIILPYAVACLLACVSLLYVDLCSPKQPHCGR